MLTGGIQHDLSPQFIGLRLLAPEAIQKLFTENGYLLIRGAIDCEKVLAAHSKVMSRLHDVGEIQKLATEGIATGAANVRASKTMAENFGQMSITVSHSVR